MDVISFDDLADKESFRKGGDAIAKVMKKMRDEAVATEAQFASMLEVLKSFEGDLKSAYDKSQAAMRAADTTRQSGTKTILEEEKVLTELAATYKQLKADMERLEAEYEKLKKKTDETKKKTDEFAEGSLRGLQKELRKTEDELSRMNASNEAFTSTSQKAKKLENDIKNLKAAIRSGVNDTESGADSLNRLKNVAKDTSASYNQLSAAHGEALRRLKAFQVGVNGSRKDFELLQGEINKTTTRLKNWDSSVNIHNRNVGNYRSALENLKGTFASSLGAGGMTSALAAGGMAGVAAAVVTGVIENAGAAISLTKELSYGIYDLSKFLGMSYEEAERFNMALGQIKTATPVAELREMAVAAGKLNVPTEEVTGFVESLDKALTVMKGEFKLGIGETSELLGKLKGLFADTRNMKYDEALTKISAALVEAGKSGAASGENVAEFTMIMGQLGQMAPRITETMAFGAILEENAINARIGAGGLKNILLQAGREAEGFSKQLKMSMKDYRELAQNRPYELVMKLAQSLQGLDNVSLAQTLEKLKIGTQESISVMAVFRDKIDDVRGKYALLNSQFLSGTLAQEEFAKKSQTMGARIDVLGKQFRAFGELLAGLMAMAFVPLLEFLAKGAEALVDFANGTDATVNKMRRAYTSQNEMLSGTSAALNPLIERYDALRKQEKLTADEQKELNEVVKQIGTIMPNAVKQFDAYGNALDINRSKLTEFLAQNEQLRESMKKNLLGGLQAQLENARTRRSTLQNRLTEGTETPTGVRGGIRAVGAVLGFGTATDQIDFERAKQIQAEMADLLKTEANLQAEIDALNGKRAAAPEAGAPTAVTIDNGELSVGELQAKRAQLKRDLDAERAKGAAGDANKIAALRKEITEIDKILGKAEKEYLTVNNLVAKRTKLEADLLREMKKTADQQRPEYLEKVQSEIDGINKLLGEQAEIVSGLGDANYAETFLANIERIKIDMKEGTKTDLDGRKEILREEIARLSYLKMQTENEKERLELQNQILDKARQLRELESGERESTQEDDLAFFRIEREGIEEKRLQGLLTEREYRREILTLQNVELESAIALATTEEERLRLLNQQKDVQNQLSKMALNSPIANAVFDGLTRYVKDVVAASALAAFFKELQKPEGSIMTATKEAGMAAAAAAVLRSLGGFSEGGKTGSQGLFLDAHGKPVAGLVHTNEVVVRKGPAQKYERELLAINAGVPLDKVLSGYDVTKSISRFANIHSAGTSPSPLTIDTDAFAEKVGTTVAKNIPKTDYSLLDGHIIKQTQHQNSIYTAFYKRRGRIKKYRST